MEWAAHFCRFEPLPDNLPQPLALRYHGHQFRVYNPEIGDGRGFTLRPTSRRLDGAACSISAPRARARRPTAATPTAG